MIREAPALTAKKTYGVYIHIPFCKSKCKYCAFVSVPSSELQRAYINALSDELVHCPARGAHVDSIYIGGGTPSCLYRGALKRIIDSVKNVFDVAADAEITVEANPESCDGRFAEECAACGVTRISIGLQTANDTILKNIGRLHTTADFCSATERLLSNGIIDLSSDIILGLPGQTVADVIASLDVMAEKCSHISVYALSVEEGTPLYTSGYECDDDAVADMYDAAYDKLRFLGFERYEVSNFARNGRKSRHNSKYWHCEPYLGFGAAAHGYDGERTRYSHTEDIMEYISGCPLYVTRLTDRDLYNEYVMLHLRTERGIELEAFKLKFGYDICDKASDAIARAVSEGALVSDSGFLRISPDKMFVMNGIIEELME